VKVERDIEAGIGVKLVVAQRVCGRVLVVGLFDGLPGAFALVWSKKGNIPDHLGRFL
jgi:hypothetical protein